MSRSVARGVLVASVVAVVLCAPVAARACEALDRLWPWNWCRGTPAATTYAPPYAPAATIAPPFTSQCNPCVSQTCSYVPQTCYRAVSSVAPVTACQPITSCDPCTGCPVTCYRPVTVYQRTTQLIPYTTYRMVWSNPCATVPCATSCAPCAASYAPCATCPATGYAPAVGGSSCCGMQSPMASVAPPTSSPVPGAATAPPITFAPSNGAAAMPLTGGGAAMPLPGPAQPTGISNGATTAPSLENRNFPITDPAMAPKPESDKAPPSSGQGLRLTSPATDLQAYRTVRQAQYVSDSRVQRPGVAVTGPVDFGGWRASSN